MLMFPDYLDGAKVLEYTEAGHFGFITDYDDDDNPYEREICYLAICTYTGDQSLFLYLFHCDQDFQVITDDLHDSAEGYKRNYPEAVWHAKNPPYFYNAAQRKATGSTEFVEFQRGRHRTFWLERSIYLHAELFENLGLWELFSKNLPHFDYFSITEVTPAQYEILKAAAMAQGGEVAALFLELDYWVQDCFFTENVFTICGI